MKASKKAYIIIKHFEVSATTSVQAIVADVEKCDICDGIHVPATHAYLCPAQVWTIGYGHTKGVKRGDYCTVNQAENYLKQDVAITENHLTKALNADEIEVNQDMFDALVSFAFNVKGGVSTLIHSTLWKKLKEKDKQSAAEEFNRWVYATVNGQKVALKGLIKRRTAERKLFLSLDW